MAKMSTLLLGSPERLVKENENTSWETNKIGGSPDWFVDGTQQPYCSNCGKEMTLVTQIYCPLNDSPFHRCLHIFVCIKRGCSNQAHGWRVIRTQLLDEVSQRLPENIWGTDQDDWDEGQNDWGEGQDDWGEDQDDWGCQDQVNKEQDSGQPSQQVDPTNNTMSKLSEMAIIDVDNSPTTHQTDSNNITTTHPASQPSSGGESKSFAGGVSESSGKNNPQHAEESSSAVSDDLEACSTSIKRCENAEDQEVGMDTEAVIAVNEEGVQRMLGLLAVPQEAENSQQENFTNKEANGVLTKTTFPAYYLEVFAESDVEMGASESEHIRVLMHDYMQAEGKEFATLLDEHRKGQKGSHTEQYDKTNVKHGDKLCYKFIKRLQLFPQQCIRYQRNGSPLLMSQPSGMLTTDRCQSCGSSRVFELQLVSPLISLLVLPGETESRVEFGTVLVYTCGKSCWSEGATWREEAVLFQHDPYHQILK